jgi:hypothetical protein
MLFSAQAQTQAAMEDFRCFAGPEGIENDDDFRLDGFFLAVRGSEGPVIRVNREAISKSDLSPTTLEFLYQRECARFVLGHLDLPEEDVETHRAADCLGFNFQFDQHFVERPELADRAVRTIERDFEYIGQNEWPSTIGPPRRIDLERCRGMEFR